MLLEPLSAKTSAIQNQVCTGYHPQNEGKYLEVAPDVFLKKLKLKNPSTNSKLSPQTHYVKVKHLLKNLYTPIKYTKMFILNLNIRFHFH